MLKIGCGIGTGGLQFARNGATYVGIDLSPVSVQYSRERFGLLAIKGQFEVTNTEKQPFVDESFDHVCRFGLIHHLQDTDAIVREVNRVFLRRLFRLMRYPRRMPAFISNMTVFDHSKLERHREIVLRKKR